MAKVFDTLTEETKEFIRQQKVFFVSTSPSNEGEINISPKGYDTLRIIEKNRVLYLDYHGSGNETANHLNENGKITFMWCSFEEQSNILRVYGKGKVITKGTDLFDDLLNQYFKNFRESIVRQIFDVQVSKVQTSCGWGVPYMTYSKERPILHDRSIKAFVSGGQAASVLGDKS